MPALGRMAAALSAVLLAGCASLSPDGGLNDVSRLTQERIGQPAAFAKPTAQEAGAGNAQVQALLSQPLSADTAVQIALLNSPALKASFAELGLSEAEFVQAGRLRNPSFGFSRVRGGSDKEIERSVTFDLVGLLTLPARHRIEQGRFEQAKLQAAATAI